MKKYRPILIILLILLLAVPSAAQMVIGSGNTVPITYSSDLCTGGTAFANGTCAESSPVAQAFDDNETTFAGCYTGSPVTSIGYHFSSGHAVCRVRLKPVDSMGLGALCKDFKIQGSNTGGDDYVDLYQGQHANTELWETYSFNNSTSYTYVRILYKSVWAPLPNYLYFYEIEMMEATE